MRSTRFHRIECGNERGVAAHATRISVVNPVRRNRTGLCPNHDLGQRMAHQYRKIPTAMTARFRPTRNGSFEVCAKTIVMGATANKKWRYSGAKVMRPSMDVKNSAENRSGRTKKRPRANTASVIILPSVV